MTCSLCPALGELRRAPKQALVAARPSLGHRGYQRGLESPWNRNLCWLGGVRGAVPMQSRRVPRKRHLCVCLTVKGNCFISHGCCSHISLLSQMSYWSGSEIKRAVEKWNQTGKNTPTRTKQGNSSASPSLLVKLGLTKLSWGSEWDSNPCRWQRVGREAGRWGRLADGELETLGFLRQCRTPWTSETMASTWGSYQPSGTE